MLSISTSAGGQTVAQAVQGAYAAGKRPAFASEWYSILAAANGGSLAQGLDYPAFGNGAAVYFDDSNQEFVQVCKKMPLAANDSDVLVLHTFD
jgi:hypothetical protein